MKDELKNHLVRTLHVQQCGSHRILSPMLLHTVTVMLCTVYNHLHWARCKRWDCLTSPEDFVSKCLTGWKKMNKNLPFPLCLDGRPRRHVQSDARRDGRSESGEAKISHDAFALYFLPIFARLLLLDWLHTSVTMLWIHIFVIYQCKVAILWICQQFFLCGRFLGKWIVFTSR